MKLGPLEEREFRLFFVGQATSLLGDYMVPVALAFAVFELGGSATDLGVAVAAGAVPMAVFFLVGGVWADRLPRQRLMLAADAVRFVTQAVAAILLLAGFAAVWHLVVLQIVRGTAAAFFGPAAGGLVPLTVSRERLQEANALLGIAGSSVGIAGAAVAGASVAAFGPGWTFALDAATYLVSIGFLAAIRLPRRDRSEATAFLAALRSGWAEFSSRAWVWVSVARFTVFNMAVYAPFMVVGPVVAARSLGGAAAWGAILASLNAGAFIGGWLSLKVRVRRPLVAVVMLGSAYGVVTALLAVDAPTAGVATGAVAAGAGSAIAATLWSTTLQREIPESVFSRVYAYTAITGLLFAPLGYLLAGIAADTLSPSTVLWIATAALLVSGAAAIAVPQVRRLQTGDRERVLHAN